MAFTTWSKDIILCLIAIKTITATKKVLNIIYGFKDNNKQILGTYIVRNEIETKRNETNENETKRNEINKNETKRNEINEMKTK